MRSRLEAATSQPNASRAAPGAPQPDRRSRLRLDRTQEAPTGSRNAIGLGRPIPGRPNPMALRGFDPLTSWTRPSRSLRSPDCLVAASAWIADALIQAPPGSHPSGPDLLPKRHRVGPAHTRPAQPDGAKGIRTPDLL